MSVKKSTRSVGTKSPSKTTGRLAPAEVRAGLAELPGWKLVGGKITRTFTFKSYDDTIAFVNAAAWVAQSLNHHPDLEVGYGKCVVKFSTHDVGGLSGKDLEAARGVDAMWEMKQRA